MHHMQMSKFKIFLRGMRMGMDPALAFGRHQRLSLYYRSYVDRDPSRSDWEAVGNDLSRAIAARSADRTHAS